MKLSGWLAGLIDFLSDLRRSVLDQRCPKDDSWGTQVGTTADGEPLYECEFGHIFTTSDTERFDVDPD